MIPRLLGEINDSDTEFTALLKQKQEMIFVSVVGFITILIIFLVVLSGNDEAKGTWRYGLCKVFLERYAQYPTHIKLLTSGEKQNSAQLGYININSYGSQNSEMMECFYNIDQNGVTLNHVTVNRRTFNQDMVNEFNQSIPIILEREDLDLVLPPRLGWTLESLKFE
jgi:hypothetical protein